MRFYTTRSWFSPDHEDEEFKVYYPCGRSHEEWLEQEELVEFMQKDIKMRQLCRISYLAYAEIGASL